MNPVVSRVRNFLGGFPRWALLAALVGAVCGLAGTAFHVCVNLAAQWREQLPWLLYLLPLAGLLIVWLYGRLKQPVSLGTDDLFNAIHDRAPVPPAMAPLIFTGTFLTHLCGGSAGREGAALQLGGCLANRMGLLLRLDRDECAAMTLMGMAALFSALFGTPLTAAVFVVEVIAMGQLIYSSLAPCLIASLTAYGVSLLLGMKPEGYALAAAPALGWLSALRVAALAALCALLSLLFCATMHFFGHRMKQWIKNPYARAAAGGVIIVALTLLAGTRDYNGAGGAVIERAVAGSARPWDFIMKLLFTAITLSCGFKGGEIVPTFFVGATFGCVVGPLLGLDPGFAAAVGLTAAFCGNTNCPIASAFLAMELFGFQAVPLFALACGVAYALSGSGSLYHAQRTPAESLKRGGIVLPEAFSASRQ